MAVPHQSRRSGNSPAPLAAACRRWGAAHPVHRHGAAHRHRCRQRRRDTRVSCSSSPFRSTGSRSSKAMERRRPSSPRRRGRGTSRSTSSGSESSWSIRSRTEKTAPSSRRRAVAPLAKLLEMTKALRESGRGLFYKGESADDELTDSAVCWRIRYVKHRSIVEPKSSIMEVLEARRIHDPDDERGG